jgi:hypothetical protein
MRRLGLLALLTLIAPAAPATAAMTADLVRGGSECRQAIAAVERASGIPPGLLGAIARVESGRRNPDSGAIEPWPWTADVEGTGAWFATKAEAVAAVRRSQAQGVGSIDVGCMQVNLAQHPEAFPSLEAAFDPASNVAYASRFLRELHDQTGDWAKAAAMYHSATPAIGAAYQAKVLAAWPEERRRAAESQPNAVTRAWTASLGGSPFGGGSGFAVRRTIGAQRPPAGMAAPGAAAPAGRGLAAYRAVPIMVSAGVRMVLRK